MRWLTRFIHRSDRGAHEQVDERVEGYEGFGSWLGRGRHGADGLRPRPAQRWTSGDVVGECEAFLSGNYRQLLVRSGRAVPGWAWINQLAHGTLDDVRSLARFAGGSIRATGPASTGEAGRTGRAASAEGNGRGKRDGDEAVGAFVGRLARQVLVKMRQEHAQLDTVQRDLLIPLELALAAQVRRVPTRADDLSREVSRRLVSGLEPIDVGVRGGSGGGEAGQGVHGDDGEDHGRSDIGGGGQAR